MIKVKKVIATLVMYFILSSSLWLLVIINSEGGEDNMGAYFIISMVLVAIMYAVARLFEWALDALYA